MHNSRCVLIALRIILYCIHLSSSLHHDHCLTHLHHRQPSIGHHLLRIEQSIENEQSCHHRCSMDHSCSMVTFHGRHHRCHLFNDHHPHLRYSHHYRSHHRYSTFTHCPGHFLEHQSVNNVHCDYDSLPWQRVHTSRSLVFQSYTLIGISHLPCQELCSSVRHCAAVQYQVRGSHHHRCRLLRSAKPWELIHSRTWTIFVKRSCHVQIDHVDLFSHDKEPLCTFRYFGEGHHKHHHAKIHSFTHLSELQCQYVCSKMIHCLGVEFVERRSECILLSANILRNDGSIDVKHHHHHHISMKVSCATVFYSNDLSPCPVTPVHHCHHGTCLYQRSEGYQTMSCHCHRGFTGDHCDRTADEHCPCVNGGLCETDRQRCRCSPGYHGDLCQMISY